MLDIIEISVKNNPKHSITGILCYDESYFLQWIEGPRKTVYSLYNNMVNDSGHTDLQILDYSYIGSREFPNWAMACVKADDIEQDTVLRYVYEHQFDPYMMSGEGARMFLAEVAPR